MTAADPPPRGAARTVLRVAVVHGARRLDLAVAAHVPVVELLPALVEIAAPEGVAAPVLLTHRGDPVDLTAPLAAQGVVDGDLLALATPEEAPGPPDDVAAALAALVEARAAAAPPAPGTVRPLLALALLLAPVAALPGVPAAGAVALALTAGLVALAAVVARAGAGAGRVAVVAAVAASVYAAAAGALLAPPVGGWLGLPLAVAGSAAALTGAAGLAVLRERRLEVLPVVVVGVLVACAALAARLSGAPVPSVAVAVAGAAVLALPALPRVALSVSGLDDRLASHPAPDPAAHLTPDLGSGLGPDLDTAHDTAHDVVLAGALSTAALLALVAPLAVDRGPAATGVVVAGGVLLLIGGGHHRAPGLRRATTVAGGVVLAVVAVAVAVLEPGWRPVGAVPMLLGGLALVCTPSGHPLGTGPRGQRARTATETAALVLVLPLVCLASGLVEAAAGTVLGALGPRP